MDKGYIVLERTTVRKVLTSEEITLLDTLIKKVRDHEGLRTFEVNETTKSV